MVVIRRELPRTRVVGQARGLPHRAGRGSSYPCPPRPTRALFLKSHLRLLVFRLSGVASPAAALLLLLDLDSDRPDEPEQLPADGDSDLLLELALSHEAPIARAESVLRLPVDLLDLFAEPLLTFPEQRRHGRPMLVGPRCLSEDAAQVRVAGLGDRPPADAPARRALARDHAAVTHDLLGPREAGERACLGHDGRRRYLLDPAQGLQSSDESL